jgi:hypothetical protein
MPQSSYDIALVFCHERQPVEGGVTLENCLLGHILVFVDKVDFLCFRGLYLGMRQDWRAVAALFQTETSRRLCGDFIIPTWLTLFRYYYRNQILA